MPEYLIQQSEELFNTLMKYCEQCLNGEITIGQKQRWAIERFLKDLEDPRYYFDKIELLKFNTWARSFKHRAGILAGKPINLIPFQLFEVGNILCLKRRDNRRRKYKKAYIQMGRKNAKTQMLALISSYIAYNSNEQQEIYVAGWVSDQSKNLYRDLEFQLGGCDKLKGKYKTSYGKITFKKDGSFIQPLTRESRKSGDGTNPSLGIVDEYHAHQTSEIYDVIMSGMGARPEPLMIIITTAGFDLTHPCYNVEYKMVSKIINPAYPDIDDDEYFILICELDEGDDIKDESVWPKANPVVCTYPEGWEGIRSALKSALISPEKMRDFLTKRMDKWVNMRESGYMDMQKWDRCQREFTLEDFRGMGCILALDLSVRNDLTSIGLEFSKEGDYYVFQHSFMPEDKYQERMARSNTPFDIWVNNEDPNKETLTLCSGSVIDYNDVFAYIKHIEDEYELNILEVAYDPYNATQFVQRLEEEGYICVEIRQGPLTLNEPTKDFRDCVYDDTLHHNGDGLLTWAIGNAVTRQNAQEYILLDKAKSEDKIDPAAALMNAHCRAMELLGEDDGIFWCPDLD